MGVWSSGKVDKALRVLRKDGVRVFAYKGVVFVRDSVKYAGIALWSKLLYILYRWRWGACLASRDKLIYINPSDIHYRLVPPFYPVHIAGGDWDLCEQDRKRACGRKLLPLRDMAVYRMIRERFVEGRRWEDTALARRPSGHSGTWRTDYPDDRYDAEALDKRFHELDKLHALMLAHGYRSQAELGGEGRHEVTVNIGRHGQVIWNGTGQHRLAMAEALGFRRIPARVLVRHTRWQQIRNSIARGMVMRPTYSAANGHPDLEEFFGGRSESVPSARGE